MHIFNCPKTLIIALKIYFYPPSSIYDPFYTEYRK